MTEKAEDETQPHAGLGEERYRHDRPLGIHCSAADAAAPPRKKKKRKTNQPTKKTKREGNRSHFRLNLRKDAPPAQSGYAHRS